MSGSFIFAFGAILAILISCFVRFCDCVMLKVKVELPDYVLDAFCLVFIFHGVCPVVSKGLSLPLSLDELSAWAVKLHASRSVLSLGSLGSLRYSVIENLLLRSNIGFALCAFTDGLRQRGVNDLLYYYI
jgi:hypothetical protein